LDLEVLPNFFVFRLVINLTQPALLCFGGKIPKDSVMHHHFLNVLSHTQAYKKVSQKPKRLHSSKLVIFQYRLAKANDWFTVWHLLL